MCVPAMAVAAGCSYDVPGPCARRFDPNVQAGSWDHVVRGLWGIGNGFDPDPQHQAAVVYSKYTSNDTDNGCLSHWCKDSGCSEVLIEIGQDRSVISHHRFCKGTQWTAGSDHFVERLEAAGGRAAAQKACADAAVQVRSASVLRQTQNSAPRLTSVRRPLLSAHNRLSWSMQA